MKRVWPIVAIFAAVMVACVAAPPLTTTAAAATAAQSKDRTVYLVIAPYLTWADVTATSTPSLWRIAEQGAVASVNARSRVRKSGTGATALEGALAISSGVWALPDWAAPAAFNASETVAGGTAAESYRRTVGDSTDDADIVFLGLPIIERANRKGSVDVQLGTLGETITSAGGVTAAIGNSDTGYSDAPEFQRPAAVASMDASGLVAFGDVSAALLATSTAAPYARGTDPMRFANALASALQRVEAHGGPALVVLDAGDLARARDFSWQVDPTVAARQRAEAVAALDHVVGLAVDARGPDDVVIVASQALFADPSGDAEGFGPLLVLGEGFEGFATASSTHRMGLVTNIDITATVLEALRLERPVQVLGSPINTLSTDKDASSRIAYLSRQSDVLVAINQVKPAVSRTMVVLAVLAFALTLALALLASPTPGTVTVLAMTARGALLLALAIPCAVWLAAIVLPAPGSGAAAGAAIALGTVALAAPLFALSRRLPIRAPVAVLCLLTSLTLLAEQFVGAPLSLLSALSYSALLGARYYGIGNETAAIVFGSLVVGCALLIDAWPRARWVEMLRSWGVAVLGVVFVGVAVAPALGANVGVAIWGTAGFALAALLLRGVRLTPGRVGLIIVGAVMVVGVFAAVDVFGGGAQTHLARALEGADRGGVGTLWTIIVRKAGANARVLGSTELTWILVSAAALGALVRWRRPAVWTSLRSANAALFAVATAAIGAGIVAFFTEDSGIVIPSYMALYVGGAFAWMLLARLGDIEAVNRDDSDRQ
ncbi:MAG: hypothetical protein HGB10_04765 [Coriobacteriia bacterium]|nr:hypothetical protein [Coriobacteriia bacterium]